MKYILISASAPPTHTQQASIEIRERTATDERRATTFPKVINSAAVDQSDWRGGWDRVG